MTKVIPLLAALFVALHGLVHLIGTAAYMRLGRLEGLPYKTTLLGGRWDVGEGGMSVFGALYAVAAAAFVAAALAWQLRWDSWQALLLGAALFSLVITALDWQKAYVGVLVNVVILGALLLAPRIASAAL